ncbi:MAG: UDP-N-acetylmuramoyl-L-alanyl-D-glutamate--2,6-diaminopimelate ligase [Sphingobacteriia bacterium]|nr:UDP-N-acetylmuramoyl-L-alanyl-D-glutamate--2,6-diaminopimelate ligase [Sphingobacteriia bacterium]NCC39292.1 UDP-N-acetylmuramoyl-L-alanyl-D-glutamate--2,6-diaminopimelate ligase [Gammaproteobacteria bacterium]
MPQDPLSQLLDSLAVLWRRAAVTPRTLTNIQWRADDCDPGSILFFQRLDDGRTDAELYRRYLAGGRFAVLVTNRMLDCFDALPDQGIYVVRPTDWAGVVARFCDLVYPLDHRASHFLGVTGTNGKTTTVKYLESILTAHGSRALSIGTLGVSLAGEPLLQTGFTSPPLIELRRLLHAHRGRYDVVAMEVSSHALDQGRAHGIPLQNGAWTNFSQDHLDYHGDESAYFAAKARILDLIVADGRLYTTSTDVAQRLHRERPSPIPIELLSAATLPAEAISTRPFLALLHNRQNYALASALADGILGRAARPDWRHLSAVDGRFDCRVIGNRTLVIDFAHTPDALETILTAIRQAFPTARIATLFGCGGERDRGKRPLMGAVAARHSDQVIVTSDNPRCEDPERIIADILTGMPKEGRRVVIERPRAIACLLDFLDARPAQEHWVALLAGKGHERYIDALGSKTPYSDHEEVERNLARLGWTGEDPLATRADQDSG